VISASMAARILSLSVMRDNMGIVIGVGGTKSELVYTQQGLIYL
jgi:hypothetical protein